MTLFYCFYSCCCSFNLLLSGVVFDVMRLLIVSCLKFCTCLQDFYEDLFEELSKYGEIESLNICDNLADHMVPLFISYHIDHSRTVSNLLICCFVSKKALISDPLDL